MVYSTAMASEEHNRVELLQGTLDLIVMRALATMGPQHAYGLAARLEQVADHPLPAQPGHALRRSGAPRAERLDQRHLAAHRGGPRSQVLRLTRAGTRALERQTERWRRLATFVDKLLIEEA